MTRFFQKRYDFRVNEPEIQSRIPRLPAGAVSPFVAAVRAGSQHVPRVCVLMGLRMLRASERSVALARYD